MVLRVLQSKKQIEQSRKIMKKLHVSGIDSSFVSLLRRLKIIKRMPIGDWLKSWDVLETLDFIKKNSSKNDAILDIGCFSSEVLVALYRQGFTNLAGVDLNSNLQQMPYSDKINYANENFMHTSFDSASFNVITSISVIEHGYDEVALLTEISRLLKPGGYFISSFDYWPEKIDTDGVKYFDLSWLIFSRDDVDSLIMTAAKNDLCPVGELSYETEDKPIDCSDRQYTFGWLVLQKNNNS